MIQARIAVLASGGGTTLQAILDAIAAGELRAGIAAVVADRPGTGAIARAAAAGHETAVLDRRRLGADLSRAISTHLPRDVRLVVLAGFLSIVTEPLLSRFAGRMINVHPSLLPAYGGVGMYGDRVHRAVLAGGETVSGCTVHQVDAGTDTGRIILQRRVPVEPGDTVDTLRERVQREERRALVEAIATLLEEDSQP